MLPRSSRPSGVWPFALRVLAWLAPCLAVWYLAAPFYDRIPAWLALHGIDLFLPSVMDSVEWEGRFLQFVTTLHVTAGSREGVLVAQVNPMVSTYGTALFLALVLASGAQPKKLAAGLVAVLPFQAWGIAFDALAQLLRDDPSFVTRLGLAGWQVEGIAIGYQVGSLLLPTLAPLMAWALMHRAFIEQLASGPPRAIETA